MESTLDNLLSQSSAAVGAGGLADIIGWSARR
jgi:hypothetical protein